MPPHYLVIGSGPSGVACAAALLEKRASVTLVDVGADLTEDAHQRALQLSKQQAWSRADRGWLQRGLDADKGGVPLKSLFGEDFMYSRADIAGGVLPENFGEWPSQSLGGLSRVWGATLKRLGPRELAAWPMPLDALTPHYAAAEHLLGPSGPRLSRQADALLQQWRAHGRAMAALGARAAPSALAVSPDCRLCGMCLYGCPYGYIFSTDGLVRQFQLREGFSYRPGLKAQRLLPREHGADLIVSRADGTRETLQGDRIFVAAGVLGTAQLMLKSFFDANDSLTLRDGQYFLMPFLAKAPKSEGLHTLSQVFLELDFAQPVHVQLYTRNDVYARMLAAPFGPLAPLLRPLTDLVGRRVLMAQGYLPSAQSGSAQLRLDADGRLAIYPRTSDATRGALRDVWQLLGKVGRLAGLWTVPWLARQAEIGRGYHTGATLPMSRNPARVESDLIGRIPGADRVHVVDASVWPDIPSGPVTLTAMANAHRIAMEVARSEGSAP